MKKQLCLAAATLLMLTACGGGGGSSDNAGNPTAQPTSTPGQPTATPIQPTTTPANNSAPVASAGNSQSVSTGSTVTLDGSGSSDANGDSLTYNWIMISKPDSSTAMLSSAIVAKPTFVADLVGTYSFTLTVSDGQLTSTSTVTVTASAATATATDKLNDTGITADGLNASGSKTSCSYAVQGNDCNTGRDANSNSNSSTDGLAGFSFTKLDAAGNTLAATANTWVCLKDNVTGRTWEVKTNDGGARHWNKSFTNFGDGRTGDTSEYIAAVNTQGLCGLRNWRLPTIDELQGIVDYNTTNSAAIDAAWFTNPPDDDYYWTSTTVAGATSKNWTIYFGYGRMNSAFSASDSAFIRLVSLDRPTITNRYSYSSDGEEVIDSKTGLIWRRCAEGRVWDGNTCTGTNGQYTLATAMQRATTYANSTGKAWRLPNVKELSSIVDFSQQSPAIDQIVFPGTSGGFWSSTLDMIYYKAWTVSFTSGSPSLISRDSAGSSVRLVRDH